MIESIHLAGLATYGSTPAILDELSTFNYLYGPNGSGKTTISRVIANPTKHPTCAVSWKARDPFDALVYNPDFIETHFRASPEFPGIFTLGEKNAAIADEIAKAKAAANQLSDEIGKLQATLEGADGTGGKRDELRVCEGTFRDACWKQKQQYDEHFKIAFEGLRNSAEKFKARVSQERAANTADKKSLDYLLNKAATVFSDQANTIDQLATIDGTELIACGTAPILAKKVIGKADVDVAAMIQHLGNSDWVRSGRHFFDRNDEKCPFCQQRVQDGFAKSLSDYFDEAFEADSTTIDNLVKKHSQAAQHVIGLVKAILANPPAQLDRTSLSDKNALLGTRIELNAQRLLEKKKEPSKIIALESVNDLLNEMVALITTANEAIAAHNLTVANLVAERKTLKEQIWRFILDEPLKDAIATYDSKTSALTKAIENLMRQIKEREDARRLKEQEIRDLERSTTSIQPTIDNINTLLRSFSFDGFSIAQASNKQCYKLVRPDGTDAKETLSEGEKTFVTFLYFYHLLRGSASESGTTRDRVVVFDDPVSSLDSNILFIVSSLIRKVCDEVRIGTTNIKQVFFFTHNVYFHKEVTFHKKRGRDKLSEETFWTVRKLNGQSQLDKHTTNPIKSSYELLWMEVRSATKGSVTIQNTLRRILESYFRILGGIDLDRLHDGFEGDEKLACRALVSWVNDGSHSAHDDLYIAADDTTVERYLDVFRKIFVNEGHAEHYNMMMAAPPSVPIIA